MTEEDAKQAVDKRLIGMPIRTQAEARRVMDIIWDAAKKWQRGPSDHPDDIAVDKFAVAMKEKLALARSKGRYGWEQCSPDYLSAMLLEHVGKGDPLDVANFCMFLWSLNSGVSACQAKQFSDQMVCKKCNLVWDMNDSNPPECKK